VKKRRHGADALEGLLDYVAARGNSEYMTGVLTALLYASNMSRADIRRLWRKFSVPSVKDKR